jgi:hypothetical protein
MFVGSFGQDFLILGGANSAPVLQCTFSNADNSATFAGTVKLAVGTATLQPLFFQSGTNLTTAAAGSMEYNGTNLFFTRTGTTRESVLTGNSGAGAPSLTATPVFASFYGGNTNALGDPNSWASVVIGGTTYKIPLYT